MPAQTVAVQRRRQRSISKDDVHDFSIGSPDEQSSAKRVRINGRRPAPRSRFDVESEDDETDGTAIDGGADSFQPGAIVRVKVTNFVTYEKAEFHPGPNLNMVIGPNGTGKSSLVCAICLGLGWGPKHLGRADDLGEFVKHGNPTATIEIELKGHADSENPVIRLQITREGNKRKWWINGRDTTHKAVETLVGNLSIQVDNLCQFLPQDKVAEFAAQTPVELLHSTQRAAAPPEMLDWHEQLKKLRHDQKQLQVRHEVDQETLTNLQARQQGLQTDVARLKERAAIQDRIALLEKSIPFVEYNVARQAFKEQKALKKEAQNRLRALETQLQPTLGAVNAKQAYRDEIEIVVKERAKVVEDAEPAANLLVKKIEDLDARILQREQERKAIKDGDAQRKQDLQRLLRKIANLEAQQQNSPPEFDPVDFNNRIVRCSCLVHIFELIVAIERKGASSPCSRDIRPWLYGARDFIEAERARNTTTN
jgi:chromosome segregation ATPase